MRKILQGVRTFPGHHTKRIFPNKLSHVRFFRSTAPAESEKVRIAIVGGGASGLSTALQLAPLVERGVIAKPIDLYERKSLSDAHPHEKSSVIDENFHPGSGTIGRDIGVGIWSTALKPFKSYLTAGDNGEKDIKTIGSHLDLIKKLEHYGQYVDKVGYRTPGGSWLTRSRLNAEPYQNGSMDENEDPSLLFIQEKYFLSSLREAVASEAAKFGTIKPHFSESLTDKSTEVDKIELIKDEGSRFIRGQLQFSDKSVSSESYHIIIDATGMHSSLRKKYGGFGPFVKKWKKSKMNACELSEKWQKEQLEVKHSIMDRRYVVFRGNSPLSDADSGMNGESFQTWGEGKNMRFAAVATSEPIKDGLSAERSEKQVWFATICDAEVCSSKDAEERKRLLLASFKEWHDPICKLIESTPAEKIFMERGVGHKHSVCPVVNLSEVMEYQSECFGADNEIPTRGHGPILLFAGDANMTVDPVLAQGFTIGMESGADLARTLESCLQESTDEQSFDYKLLRKAINERSVRRFDRIMCLIRSTEIVQFMAQPSTDFGINLAKYLVRPAMMITPSFLKEIAFSTMMKYSLGYYSNCQFTKNDTEK